MSSGSELDHSLEDSVPYVSNRRRRSPITSSSDSDIGDESLPYSRDRRRGSPSLSLDPETEDEPVTFRRGRIRPTVLSSCLSRGDESQSDDEREQPMKKTRSHSRDSTGSGKSVSGSSESASSLESAGRPVLCHSSPNGCHGEQLLCNL